MRKFGYRGEKVYPTPYPVTMLPAYLVSLLGAGHFTMFVEVILKIYF